MCTDGADIFVAVIAEGHEPEDGSVWGDRRRAGADGPLEPTGRASSRAGEHKRKGIAPASFRQIYRRATPRFLLSLSVAASRFGAAPSLKSQSFASTFA